MGFILPLSIYPQRTAVAFQDNLLWSGKPRQESWKEENTGLPLPAWHPCPSHQWHHGGHKSCWCGVAHCSTLARERGMSAHSCSWPLLTLGFWEGRCQEAVGGPLFPLAGVHGCFTARGFPCRSPFPGRGQDLK